MIKLLAVIGPTASGKTDLGIELAKQHDGEVISVDSRQIYLGMDIGTAKAAKRPNVDPFDQSLDTTELWREPVMVEGVPHYLLDILRPDQRYTAFDFKRQAETLIAGMVSRGKMPILVGGTGLYFNALLFDYEAASTPSFDPELKANLHQRYLAGEAEILAEELRKLDPVSAAKIHPNNPHHLLRALEYALVVGKPKSETVARAAEPRYDVAFYAKELSREVLYERINLRVDLMLEAGLVEETKKLLEHYALGSGPLSSIGYAEISDYLAGKTTLAEAAELIKQKTRNYAKRQMTWFRQYAKLK
jgi:tRNA dimethylallyltransferase